MRIKAALAALWLAAGCASVSGRDDCGGSGGARAAMRAIIAADNARDLDAVMPHYTDDVVWRPPGRAALVGAPAIRESYVRMYSDFLPVLAIAIKHVHVEDRRATLWGRTSGLLRPARPDVAETQVSDHFAASLRCEAGRWRVAEMSWGPAADR